MDEVLSGTTTSSRIREILPPPVLTKHPVDVGLRSEAAIVSELLRRGYYVLEPRGFNHRYDLVIDTGERFLRVQCKTGRLRNGTGGTLRIAPTENNQAKRIRWASDYLLPDPADLRSSADAA
jgi:hypothetical protein